MFIGIFVCVVLVFMALGINEEIKNNKLKGEILELARQEKEINLHRIKERQKYVNVILDFDKEENQ